MPNLKDYELSEKKGKDPPDRIEKSSAVYVGQCIGANCLRSIYA